MDAAQQLLNLSQKELDQLPAELRQKIEVARKQVFAAKRLHTVQTARDDLLAFVEMSMPDPTAPDDPTKTRYQRRKVHEYIARSLEKVERGEILRLIISVQPRVGKSELVSRKFPAWMMGRDPYKQIITATYGEELGKDFGREVRATMKSPFFNQVFPQVELRKNSQAADRLQTTAGGTAVFVGAGGTITGRGADCVSFDTQCIVVDGEKPISDIRVGDRVWAHDHTTGKDTWTTVRAVSTQYKPELINVGPLRCTPDHRVWTEERGYVRAENIQSGTFKVREVPPEFHSTREGAQTESAQVRRAGENILFARMRAQAQRAETPHLQMWGGKSETRTYLFGVLPGKPESYTRLRRLWKDVHSTILRARKISSETRRECFDILRQGVLRPIPQDTISTDTSAGCSLSYLWGADNRYAPSKVLLGGVLPYEEKTKLGLLGQVESASQSDGKAGRRQVRKLWGFSKAGSGASHRPRREKPRTDQPGATVRTMPRALSSAVFGTCAKDLAQLLPEMGGHLVADIQTDTGNFFANGILAHNCLLIDDPIKDAEEARSKARKDAIWEWYSRTAYSRLMGRGGAVVITMTRWAEDDLVGRLTEPKLGYVSEDDAKQWTVINIPAFAEEDDPLGRAPGEILWPDRTPKEFLESFRSLDPAGFAALYMGRPSPPEGNFITRDNIKGYQAHQLPSNLRYYAASDHAISQEQRRDSTCMGVVGVDSNDNIYILPDLVWAQLDAEDQVEAMMNLMRSKRPLSWWAEKGHISKSIGPFLRKRMLEEEVYCSIIEKTPVKDKQTRAQSIQARMSMGKVFFPVFAPWYAEAVEQMLNFPNGAHDDFVDFIAWIGIGLSSLLRADAPVQHVKEEPKSGSLEWILKSSERIRKQNASTEKTARYLH